MGGDPGRAATATPEDLRVLANMLSRIEAWELLDEVVERARVCHDADLQDQLGTVSGFSTPESIAVQIGEDGYMIDAVDQEPTGEHISVQPQIPHQQRDARRD